MQLVTVVMEQQKAAIHMAHFRIPSRGLLSSLGTQKSIMNSKTEWLVE